MGGECREDVREKAKKNIKDETIILGQKWLETSGEKVNGQQTGNS